MDGLELYRKVGNAAEEARAEELKKERDLEENGA